MKSKKEILVSAHYFLPTKNAGGPPKSIANLIDAMKEKLEFKVMCCDHEFRRPAEKFKSIRLGKWTEFDGYKVIYLTDSFISTIKLIFESFDRTSNIIYFNSFFDIKYTIFPIFFTGFFSNKKIVLAPRGEFSLRALMIKQRKKNFYLTFFRICRFHKRVEWHASSLKEKLDLKNYWGSSIAVTLLPNFPNSNLPQLQVTTNKVSGKLRMVYLARIAKIKNLLSILKALHSIDSSIIDFDIFGPLEDLQYWKDCEAVISTLPRNIQVTFRGPIESSDVLKIIAGYDLYVLLTQGENFGHTIYEALSASVPVLISDQTPWRQLQDKNAGWDLPLGYEDDIVSALEVAVSWDASEIKDFKKGAYQLACNFANDSNRKETALDLFT